MVAKYYINRKYLETNLTKEVKCLYPEYYKIRIFEMEEYHELFYWKH